MKKRKSSELVTFSFRLLLGLVLCFLLQSAINQSMDVEWDKHLIIPAYISNYLLVLLSFWIILILKDKKNNSLGFIFMGGFLLKMAVFFLFFKPVYLVNGNIEKAEFAAFFVPYAICLSYETYRLVRILNKS